MSCQDILAMRKLITQKYDEYEPHLNPFCRMLFCENWEWPSSYFPQACQSKSKNTASKTSLKADITSWFLSLTSQQKCAYTTIKNPRFLLAFLQTYRKCNPCMLYHIYQNRQIPDYISKNGDREAFKKIQKHLRIAWVDEPILYFQIEEEGIEAFFLEFISWIDEISCHKAFEYAHKVKNKNEPEENILWFTEQSFQQLQAWLVNEFEKIIIKNYYDKNNFVADIYDRVSRLKESLTKKAKYTAGINQTCKKELENLLSMEIADAKEILTHEELAVLQAKVKAYEDRYYEETALLLDFENCNPTHSNREDDPKKKKKRNKKKKNKTKSKDCLSEEEEGKAKENPPEDSEDRSSPHEDLHAIIEGTQQVPTAEVEEINQFEPQPSILMKEKAEDSPQKHPDSPPKFDECPQGNQNSLDKISIFEELESSQSICSSQWSRQNDKQFKVNNQSKVKSHPEFYESKHKLKKIEEPRSLSQEKEGQIRGARGSIGVRKDRTSSRKGGLEEFYQKLNLNESTEQLQKSSECMENSSEFVGSEREKDLKENSERKRGQDSMEKREEEAKNEVHPTHGDKNIKKRKKKNKTVLLQKQLSQKISTSIINRQLNQFVDSLSLQTNNLYDYKRVSFERVRSFIQSLFPAVHSMLFGSNAVGLSLPTSDIDILLSNLPCYGKQQAAEILAHIAIQINTMGWIVSCSAYLNAKVPVVKLEIDPSIPFVATKRKCDFIVWPMNIHHLQLLPKKEAPGKQSRNYERFKEIPHTQRSSFENAKSGGYEEEYVKNSQQTSEIIKVDISVNLNDSGNLGAHSTELMRRWMLHYPQIQRAVIAFKYILAERGYSSNFKGGIGSYCLFIMIAAFVKEFPQTEKYEDGEFFLAILKFYGEEFENHLKSIRLISSDPESPNCDSNEDESQSTGQIEPRSCFITLEETCQILNKTSEYTDYSYQFSPPSKVDSSNQDVLYYVRQNPLRIFDPINSRIMSGSCQLYPQIKAEFRRIEKELKELEVQVHQEVEISMNVTEMGKMLENKKCFDKWVNKYEVRSGFSIKKIFKNDS